jgi:hypothetical protein
MFPFTGKTSNDEIPGTNDKIVWRLLDTPVHDRQVALMAALQSGELRLSEASDVLLTVDRIESLSRPMRPMRPRYLPYVASDEPYWQQEGRRFIF